MNTGDRGDGRSAWEYLFSGIDTGWMRDGACVGMVPDSWHPEGHASPRVTDYAKNICGDCPVRLQCLDYAITSEIPLTGIWAGTTLEQRRAARRTNRKHAS